MSKTVMTGKQIKEVLRQALGGIYFENGLYGVVTDVLYEYTVTEDGLMAEFGKCLTLNIPISDEEIFTNYAIEGADGEEVEEAMQQEWDGSTYFDYKFEISGYTLCFNTVDKGITLTWEQFKELTDSNDGIFAICSVDGGSLYINARNCTIGVNDTEIEIDSQAAHTTIDSKIIEEIYNDSTESGDITYRFEFNNGMSDMEIELDYRVHKF
jgi:hypothetical protein